MSVKKLSKGDWSAILLASFLICFFLSLAPTTFVSPSVSQPRNGAPHQAIFEKVLQWIVDGTHSTDWVIAFVGLDQLFVLRRQAGISDRQTDIQHAQHALAARPRVIFRYAELDSEGEPGDREPRVFYRITSVGGSTARITKFFAAARTYKASFGPINLDRFLRELPEARPIAAGQSFEDKIELAMPKSQFDLAWRQIQEAILSNQLPKTKIVFMAMVCYEDDAGLVRQASVLRTLNIHTLRFLPSDDPSCEYSD